jgi:hypothetical protein
MSMGQVGTSWKKITIWFGFHGYQKILVICGDKNIAPCPDLQKYKTEKFQLKNNF